MGMLTLCLHHILLSVSVGCILAYIVLVPAILGMAVPVPVQL